MRGRDGDDNSGSIAGNVIVGVAALHVGVVVADDVARTGDSVLLAKLSFNVRVGLSREIVARADVGGGIEALGVVLGGGYPRDMLGRVVSVLAGTVFNLLGFLPLVILGPCAVVSGLDKLAAQGLDVIRHPLECDDMHDRRGDKTKSTATHPLHPVDVPVVDPQDAAGEDGQKGDDVEDKHGGV